MKFAGIGAIILVTGILASFSGGFAFSTIFGEKDYGKIQEENIKDTLTEGSSLIAEYGPYLDGYFLLPQIPSFLQSSGGL